MTAGRTITRVGGGGVPLAVALALLLWAASVFALNFPALSGRVVDQANIIPAETRGVIAAKLGATADAMKEYQAAQKLFEELVALDSSRTDALPQLAVTHNNLALLLAGALAASGTVVVLSSTSAQAVHTCRLTVHTITSYELQDNDSADEIKFELVD